MMMPKIVPIQACFIRSAALCCPTQMGVSSPISFSIFARYPLGRESSSSDACERGARGADSSACSGVAAGLGRDFGGAAVVWGEAGVGIQSGGSAGAGFAFRPGGDGAAGVGEI